MLVPHSKPTISGIFAGNARKASSTILTLLGRRAVLELEEHHVPHLAQIGILGGRIGAVYGGRDDTGQNCRHHAAKLESFHHALLNGKEKGLLTVR